MSKILELEKLLGFIISKNDFSTISPTKEVSYSWGDKYELNQWIIMKDKEISGKRAFGKQNRSKYPLIWLIHPLEGEVTSDGNLFDDLQIIVAMDTKAEWLNSTREKETMPILTNIANYFLDVLDQDKNASIIKKNGERKVRYKKVYNYQEPNAERFRSAENSNATTDIWDAITLKFDLKINNNCLKNIQLCQ